MGFRVLILFMVFALIKCMIVVENDSTVKLFEEFIQKYNRTYAVGSNEYFKRLQIFEDNVALHKKLNLNGTSPHSAVYGINKFSDLSQDEFKDLYLSSYITIDHGKTQAIPLSTEGHFSTDLPSKVDWRTKGIITAIKNQESCGGCWAYASIETVESMYAMHSDHLRTLSVQQPSKHTTFFPRGTIVENRGYRSVGKLGAMIDALSANSNAREVMDCSNGYNKYLYSCKGGDICEALLWMKTEEVAVQQSKDYPTTNKISPCKITPPSGVFVNNYNCSKLIGHEDQLLSTLANVGPVSVSVDASMWYNYQGGIIQYHCGEVANNHAVQLVGYDLTGPIPFYIAKNSWGKEFGLNGYLYLEVYKNMCGLAQEVASVSASDHP